ncbi:MAG: hypothetical protein A4E66_00674 [Syntrophus sp. PtaB.Bin001]|nr:MAG: hypothetical protein A4E66_00674 [Syntrophus sp. PtaB.Bin001]
MQTDKGENTDMKMDTCPICGRHKGMIHNKEEKINVCWPCNRGIKSLWEHGLNLSSEIMLPDGSFAIARDIVKSCSLKSYPGMNKRTPFPWVINDLPQQPEKEKPAKQENDALQDSASVVEDETSTGSPIEPAITMGIDVFKPGLYESIATEIGRLVDQKNAAYGDVFNKCPQYLLLLYPNGITPDQYPDMLALVRDFDKSMRIATNKDALGENPWRDKAGYAIMMNKPKD